VVDTIATDAPSRPRILAVANPIPVALPAPVMNATHPADPSSIERERTGANGPRGAID
jgi:hypothetical protein